MARKTTGKSKQASAGAGGRSAGASKPSAGAVEPPAGRLIDQRIRELSAGPAGWRGATLARMRSLILEAEKGVVEDVKWRKPSNSMAGVPVWSHGGIICTGEVYAKVVKLTFANGADLPDPTGLFNASLEGNTRRAIDIGEGQAVDPRAFKALIKAAVARNARQSTSKSPGVKAKKGDGSSKTRKTPAASGAGPVKLLSGGNPQIAKAYGDAPVQAYIAAMPGWKREVGRRIDAIITAAVPGVRKAVKWNSPLYGVQEGHWFLGVHCMTKYVKVAFFRGASLQPPPPGESKQKHVRYLDIYEAAPLDDVQFADWVKQASRLPGEKM